MNTPFGVRNSAGTSLGAESGAQLLWCKVIFASFGVAAALSSLLTKLRFAGVLGLGEVLFLIWILGVLVSLRLRLIVIPRGRFVVVPVAMLLSLGGILIGGVYSETMGVSVDWLDFAKLSYNFALLFLLYQALSRVACNRWVLERSLVWLVHAFSTAAVLICIASLIAHQFGYEVYYENLRFAAFAINPNQVAFAMMVSIIGLVSVLRAGRITSWVLLGLSLFFGFYCLSDGFLVGLLLFAVTFFVVFLMNSALGAMFGLPLLMLLFVGFLLWGDGLALIEEFAQRMDEGNGRAALLLNGIEAFWSQPLLGLGAGAHSGFAGPHMGEEAHNTYVDWVSAGGLLAITGMLGLLAYITFRVWRSPLGMASFAFFLVLTSVHTAYRHPAFWLAIVFLTLLHFGRKQPAVGDGSIALPSCAAK